MQKKEEKMLCPRCNCQDVLVVNRAEESEKRRGFAFFLCFVLFFPVSILFFLIPKRKIRKEKIVFVCKKCGCEFQLEEN